jgi:hypothetical protein
MIKTIINFITADYISACTNMYVLSVNNITFGLDRIYISYFHHGISYNRNSLYIWIYNPIYNIKISDHFHYQSEKNEFYFSKKMNFKW